MDSETNQYHDSLIQESNLGLADLETSALTIGLLSRIRGLSKKYNCKTKEIPIRFN